MDTVFDPRLGKMVDRRTGMPVSGGAQPPAQVGTLDQIFNGTGIPERVTTMNEILNPMVAMRDAGKASQTLFDPDTTGWGRVGAFGNMASNMAGVLAPAMAAKSVGGKPVDAIVEALTNYSAKPKMLADEFLADEFGGIKLYHGSPHDFDKFSMDKIGTGEGAQAYGHGLYFAESEGVAKSYRDVLAKSGTDGAQRRLQAAGGDIDAAIAAATEKAAKYRAGGADSYAEAVEEDLRFLEKFKQTGDWTPGRLYEVEVNANPEDFLDWDAPLAGQTGKPKQALDDFFDWYAGPEGRQEIYESGVNLKDVQQQFDDLSPEQFSAAMRARGVPGSRYRDAGSRGMPGGLGNDETRNYVIFDENLISIVKKYGIAGAATMLGMSQADLEASMQPQSMRDVLQ